jgi:hypothetical protein
LRIFEGWVVPLWVRSAEVRVHTTAGCHSDCAFKTKSEVFALSPTDTCTVSHILLSHTVLPPFHHGTSHTHSSQRSSVQAHSWSLRTISSVLCSFCSVLFLLPTFNRLCFLFTHRLNCRFLYLYGQRRTRLVYEHDRYFKLQWYFILPLMS